MRGWSTVYVALVALPFIIHARCESAFGGEPNLSLEDARTDAANPRIDLSIQHVRPVVDFASNNRSFPSLATLHSVFVEEQLLSERGGPESLALGVLLRLDWMDDSQNENASSHHSETESSGTVIEDQSICVSLVQERQIDHAQPSHPIRVRSACLSIDREIQALHISLSFSSTPSEAYSLLYSEGDRILLIHALDLQCSHGSCWVAMADIFRPPFLVNASIGGVKVTTSPYEISFEAVVERTCDEEYLRFPSDQAWRSGRYPRARTAMLETAGSQPPLCTSSMADQIVISSAAAWDASIDHGLLEGIEQIRGHLHPRLVSRPPASSRMAARVQRVHEQLMNVCREKRLRWEMCVELARQLHRSLALQAAQQLLQLPAVHWEPTLARPFVFLHLEKTAGTTLREFIASSARNMGHSSFVPCHGNLSCLSFALPRCGNGQNPACQVSPGRELLDLVHWSPTPPTVLAGHFSWGVWEDSPTLLRSLQPALLFINRDPVGRVISQFYQRCYASAACNPHRKQLSDWTPTELRAFVQTQRVAYMDEDLGRLLVTLAGKYSEESRIQVRRHDNPIFDLWSRLPADYYEVVVIDEGLSDAACRMILGKKTTTGLRLPYGRKEFQSGEWVVNVTAQLAPAVLTDEDTVVALERLDAVVVGLQEQWEETVRVVNHFFPWIDFQDDRDRVSLPGVLGQPLGGSQRKESAKDLGEELRSVILELNRCDMQLYERSKRRFAVQLEALALGAATKQRAALSKLPSSGDRKRGSRKT